MGHKCGLLSTVCNYIEDEPIPADHTTPDPIELNRLLARMVEAGCEYAFMECSSHAIAQKRIGGLTFAGGIFTNLTRDHLDYHKTFENYRDAKNGEFIQYVVENTQGLKTDLSLMLRFITSDRGRTADIFIDDQKLGDITIQPRMQGADEQGFFNVEYAIPESLLLDSKGNVKKKLTFKIVASPNTMCPGLYYVRLMKK